MTLPKHLGRFLWHFIKKQPIGFMFIVLTSWVWAVNEALFPYFIKYIIDIVATFTGDRGRIFNVLFWPLTGLISFWLFMDFCMRVQGILMVYVFPKFRANIRHAAFHYVQGHSYGYFSNELAGRIGGKLSDLPTHAQTILEIVIFAFISIGMNLIIATCMMFLASPIFAAITCTWMSLHLLFTILFLRKNQKKSIAHADTVSTLTGKIIDAVTNMLNIRLFAHTQYEGHYLNEFQQEEIQKSEIASWHLEKMKIFLGLFGSTFIITLILTLVYSWSHYLITIGDFTLVMMLSFNMLGLIWFLSYQATAFVRSAGTVSSALSLVIQEHAIKDAKHAKILHPTRGLIEFRNVSFGYRSDNGLFENLSVIVQPGQKVGLVGFSGAGKSTFVNLLLRFYDVNAGSILIDGEAIHEVTQDSLHKAIGMIPQDPTLFHRSLKDNIRYGKLEATDEEIIHASKLAHCDEFIMQCDHGYDTLVGERGIKLSGGQRQRIAVARAILKNAPILVLDEATSALDYVTEKLIQQSLNFLMENRTTLVIAHRLSTLSNMDRILVFDHGRIIEDGTMKSLLHAGGHFALLWKSQQHGLLPE